MLTSSMTHTHQRPLADPFGLQYPRTIQQRLVSPPADQAAIALHPENTTAQWIDHQIDHAATSTSLRTATRTEGFTWVKMV